MRALLAQRGGRTVAGPTIDLAGSRSQQERVQQLLQQKRASGTPVSGTYLRCALCHKHHACMPTLMPTLPPCLPVAEVSLRGGRVSADIDAADDLLSPSSSAASFEFQHRYTAPPAPSATNRQAEADAIRPQQQHRQTVKVQSRVSFDDTVLQPQGPARAAAAPAAQGTPQRQQQAQRTPSQPLRPAAPSNAASLLGGFIQSEQKEELQQLLEETGIVGPGSGPTSPSHADRPAGGGRSLAELERMLSQAMNQITLDSRLGDDGPFDISELWMQGGPARSTTSASEQTQQSEDVRSEWGLA